MKNKKNIIALFSAALVLASCSSNTNKFGRIDQFDENLPVPEPVSEIVKVKPIGGGAVIWVKIPDDQNIKGVVATYERNGKTIDAKISRYVDSLSIVGYADTLSHHVKICTFNADEVRSSAVDMDFNPKSPVIRTVKPTVAAAAGGVKINITGNSDKENLAVCLLRDTDLDDFDKSVKDIKWVEVTTLFTASDNVTLTRRGLEAQKAIFGVYIRDRWGNFSDTLKVLLTPGVEIQIPKTGFKYYDPGDDNCFSMSEENSTYPVSGLWDGSGNSSSPHFLAIGKCPVPCWLTIDMGLVAQLSRIATLPRINYNIWRDAHPRDFEFWGSMNPTGKTGSNEHGFDDSWFCLGKFTQYKPSGYEEDGSVGTITNEDITYFNGGNDFELNSDDYPHAFDQLRYLRIVFLDTFSTFELSNATEAAGIQFGEVTPYGEVVK
ncbi:MAG: DUF4959 domain-containing protein [Bacteroidales bacterium]|jgi:hypothetical protein|nr:DUF4959 domain-containing protein [Bacteroidales bacterium]MCI1785657.1 DUF4959 domain-containing protein [Bacteroidales bacterium]